ncbi:hypothetical protein JL722_7914 [Aureococcus anophagefferens]|nr:hypothetical protein JL722_7914 [Aureococcus anophagefferens]
MSAPAGAETPDGHVFLAETLVRVARVPDAIAHYERAAALYDDARERVAALASAARLHVERGSAAEAVAAYIAPTLAAAHLLLADGYRDLGLPEHAIESLRSVVKYRPRDAAGLSGLGAHLELGHFKQSVNAYRKAHALAPAATDVKYALAALLGEPVVPPRAPPSYVEALFDLRSRRGFLRADAARGPPPPGWDLAGLEALRNASDAPADAKRRKKKKDAPRSASEATVLETISAILTGDKGADEVQRSSVEEAIKAAPLPPLNGTVQDEPHLFAQVHGLLFDDQLLDVVLERCGPPSPTATRTAAAAGSTCSSSAAATASRAST